MDERTIARFWSKVDKRGTGGCWLWTASRNRGGYGQFNHVAESQWTIRTAHRVSWELANGPVSPGPDNRGTLCICHHCDVRHCVNPSHLFLGTVADNNADMVAKGRQASGERRASLGERNGQAKLTPAVVMEIRELRDSGVTGAEIARRLGVSQTAVSRAWRGLLWAHV